MEHDRPIVCFVFSQYEYTFTDNALALEDGEGTRGGGVHSRKQALEALREKEWGEIFEGGTWFAATAGTGRRAREYEEELT